MCLAPAIWPEGLAPKGQESIAQGLPWVSGNKRFALKGLEADAIQSRGSELIPGPYLVAPSGQIRLGEITQGKPWAGLSYFGRFGPRIGRPRALRIGAKHVLPFPDGRLPARQFHNHLGITLAIALGILGQGVNVAVLVIVATCIAASANFPVLMLSLFWRRFNTAGVVSGIGGYGNCMGVPTVGGEVNFHSSYNGNILVNAMCVGLARQDKIFLSAAMPKPAIIAANSPSRSNSQSRVRRR